MVLAEPSAKFKPAFDHLRFEEPLWIGAAPSEPNRLYVAQRRGDIFSFEKDRQTRDKHRVFSLKTDYSANEQGLLGMAFSPNFKKNRHIFLHYTAPNRPRRNIIARYQMDQATGKIRKSSRKIILQVRQPWQNHNGGMICFGPDGYLYIGLGDGGSGGDPRGHGQNKNTLLASILRIDVANPSKKKPYAIPKDNPFVNDPKAKPEIWAYGLRNPWRFSFDRKTGQLWVGDVGQNKSEEIDLVTKGGNYGWNIFEGTLPFKNHNRSKATREKPIPPIIEHDHTLSRSITGGYVYRGQKIPALQGYYIYGDFVTGWVWAIQYDGKKITEQLWLGKIPHIASFGEDAQGELYLCSFNGQIYSLQNIRH